VPHDTSIERWSRRIEAEGGAARNEAASDAALRNVRLSYVPAMAVEADKKDDPERMK
jgi:hypothetical protein